MIAKSLRATIAYSFEVNELVERRTSLGHGFHKTAMDVHDDDARPIGRHGICKGFGKFFLCRNRLRRNAEAASVRRIIHGIVKLAGDVPFIVIDLLQLADHAEARVVDNDGDDGKMQAGNRIVFVACHLDAAVTSDMDDPSSFTVEKLCAHRRRESEPHRT